MRYADLVEVYEKLNQTTKRLEKTYYLSELLKKTSKDEIPDIMLLIEGKVFPPWDDKKIGVGARLVLKAINLSTGINTSRIEEEWKKTGDLGLVAENLTKVKKQQTLFKKQLNVKTVIDNLRKLAELEGAGSVDQKIKLISELLTSAEPLEARFIVRTVLEELRVGVGSGSIRDAIVWAYFAKDAGIIYNNKDKLAVVEGKDRKKYNEFAETVQRAYDLTNDFSKVAQIANQKGLSALKKIDVELGIPIKVMLYKKAKDMQDAFKQVGKPAALEFKYDGFRCITGYTSLFVKSRGYISVKEIKVGDAVLTHRGNFKRIIAINKRVIDSGERLFEVTTYYGHRFKISEKHQVLVLRGKPTWVGIEDLRLNEKLIFPIPRITDKLPFEKELTLEDESGYSKTIKTNDFFFTFLGYWIGDGFTNNYHNTERIGLIFNAKKDQRLCKFYETNIKKYFKIKSLSKNIHNGAIYLYWRDKPLRIWLSTFFRKEWKGKILPNWFYGINKRQFDFFLRGWIESDGYTDKLGRTSISTKESSLAMGAVLLGLKFKKMIGIKKIRIKRKTYYRIVIPKSNKGYEFRENSVLIDILSIKELKNRDPRIILYNLQVEDEESYCTSMMCLHNCQIHKFKGNIEIYTRRLENVTKQFPEVIEYVKKFVKGDNFIIDSEAVGFNPKNWKYLPFQSISQRIRRKYDIERMAKEFPVELNIFDIIFYNGKNVVSMPFKQRRELLERVVTEQKKKIVLAQQLITKSLKEAEEFYSKSLQQGEEGVMVKNLGSVYKPGSRVGYGVKVKPVMESLDLVIVAAEWGEGKRAKWLTSYTIGCINEEKQILEMGKVGTGIKELELEGEITFPGMTELLKPLIIAEKGKTVKLKPVVVIEINYEEIQKSPTYSSGFALRFPRTVRLRHEKGVDDCSTIRQVRELFMSQKR